MDWIAGILLFICALFLAVIVGAIWSGVTSNRKASRMEEEIRNLAGFDAADLYVSSFNQAGVAMDRNRREILLASKDGLRTYPVESIISCEVLEDGCSLRMPIVAASCLGWLPVVPYLAAWEP